MQSKIAEVLCVAMDTVRSSGGMGHFDPMQTFFLSPIKKVLVEGALTIWSPCCLVSLPEMSTALGTYFFRIIWCFHSFPLKHSTPSKKYPLKEATVRLDQSAKFCLLLSFADIQRSGQSTFNFYNQSSVIKAGAGLARRVLSHLVNV